MKLVYNSLALQYMTAVVVILAFLNDLIEAQIAPPSKLAKLAEDCFDQEGFIAKDQNGRVFTCTDIAPYCSHLEQLVSTGFALSNVCPRTCGTCQPPVPVFFYAEIALTCIFTVDLFVTLLANSADCFRAFYMNLWSWFELGIVIVSVATVVLEQYFSGQAGQFPVKMLRLLRILRVLRLLKTFERTTVMMVSIGRSIVPMLNSFGILFVATCMYAVLGTQVPSTSELESVFVLLYE